LIETLSCPGRYGARGRRDGPAVDHAVPAPARRARRKPLWLTWRQRRASEAAERGSAVSGGYVRLKLPNRRAARWRLARPSAIDPPFRRRAVTGEDIICDFVHDIPGFTSNGAYERAADAFLSGSISSRTENGLVRNAMHPEATAALRTAELSRVDGALGGRD
jgi:hypothetical protein